MKLRTTVGGIFLLLFLSGCNGCNRSEEALSSERTTIKLGVVGEIESQLWEKVKAIARDEQDVMIELVRFNDYVTPNIALSDGSIDANAFQHAPYLIEMVQSRKLALSNVGKTFVFPLAAYSKTITSLDALRTGATVAIPNDPTNGGRALKLLHKRGLILLADASKLMPTTRDVVKNPHAIKIVELEAAQLPRALDDVDLAIINTTFASAAGLSPAKDGLFREDGDSDYVNIVAVRTEDKDASWVKKLLRAVQNPGIAHEASVLFEGAALSGWNQDEVNHD